MKKLIYLLVLVFSVSFTAQAQKKGKRVKRTQLSVEQEATLQVKKMTLALELNETQQRKITPILQQQISDRRAEMAKLRKARKEQVKRTKEQNYELKKAILDKQIAFQKDMKSILTKEQYAKFKKMKHKRKQGMKRRLKKRRN